MYSVHVNTCLKFDKFWYNIGECPQKSATKSNRKPNTKCSIHIPSDFLCCTMYLDVWSPSCSHCTLIVVLVTVITLKSFGLFGGSCTYNCTNCWSLPYMLLAWHTYDPPSSTCTLLICSEAMTFSPNVCWRSVSLRMRIIHFYMLHSP